MPYLLAVVIFLVLAAVWSRIFRRIGWPPWSALLMLIPVVGFVIISLVLAFNKWPIEKRVEELEREVSRPR